MNIFSFTGSFTGIPLMTSFFKKNRYFFVWIWILTGCSFYGTAQTMGTGLKLWLDTSSGLMGSGNNLTVWSDRAGINTFKVSAIPPTINSDAINFHPTVGFNNTDPVTAYPAKQNLIGNTAITARDGYAVFKMNNASYMGGTVIGGASPGATYGGTFFGEEGSRICVSAGTGSVHSSFAITDHSNYHMYNMDISGSTVTATLDGVSQTVTTKGAVFQGYTFTPTVGTTNNNGSIPANGWVHLQGEIAEVILYDQTTVSQRIKIESYLALKYGIHKAGNYVDSNNNILWNATANAAYHHDVFGIGIDNLSGLNQPKSNSMNTGSGNGTGQSGKGNIVISNPYSLANNRFLMIGHDTGALTEITETFGVNTRRRVQRKWKAQTTDTPGTVTLSYDTTGLIYSARSITDYLLLVDPTGTGDFTGAGIVSYSATALTGNKLSFDNVALPTGAVFTFQTLLSPVVQAKNVSFTTTTGTTTTVGWTNGNGSSRAVFMFAGSGGSPVPASGTTYTANTVFGTGTQIGTSGWYCIYNGTGSTVNVTGLTPGKNYQVMVLEYNGSSGNQLYLSTTDTANPAGLTTLNNVATLTNLSISAGTLSPVFASSTTSYDTTVGYTTTSVTLTPTTTDSKATVKINGVTVTSGSPSPAIALAVGPNVITTVVTAEDGTTTKTYTTTVNRTAQPTVLTSGTLTPLTTTYGTLSASTTFNVSGTNMLEGILITPPSGFEVSSDGITFTNSITVGAAGTITSKPVYLRLKGTIPAGNYFGDIALTSNNAATVNVTTASNMVNKAALILTTDNKTKVYGSVNPALTATYSGFVNGDNESSLTTAPNFTTTAQMGSPVGTYPITAGGAVAPNYTVSYVDGSLSVSKAALTITAEDKTKTYGSVNPVLMAAYSGFVNGDSQSSLTTAPNLTTTAQAGSPVGTYPITAGGAVASNYTISYVDGSLSVGKAALTITAEDKTKVYASVNPALTATYSGFVNGDLESSLTTAANLTTTAQAGSPVGTYPITAGGAVASNYTVSYVDGSLSVSKAALTIKAEDKTKVYGSVNPALTATYSGFVNGDLESSLTTAPNLTTTAQTGSPVGTYPVTAGGAVAPNYTISYVDGSLSVSKAALTITAEDKTKVYGSVNPALTAAYSGFVNGDLESSLTTAPNFKTTAQTESPVGTYPITAGGAVASNYTISYVDGSLSVSKATLRITAEDKTKIYGSVNPALMATYSGFVNGDNESSLITAPNLTTTAHAGSQVGTYPVTASGAVASNYTISYVDGSLSVNKAALTITAEDKTKACGLAIPALTAAYSGFVNGDSESSLTTAPNLTTTAQIGSPVGTYPITASGAIAPNYTVSYVDGTLIISGTINATNDSGAPVNSAVDGVVVNVLDNDLLNCTTATVAKVKIALAGTLPAGINFDTTTGKVIVNAHTPAGTYTFDYTICDLLNPSNCSTATVKITVEASKIETPVQTPSFVIGATGGTTPSIISDVKINGQPVVIGTKPGEVILSGTKVPSGLTLNPDGTVTVPPNTPGGSYTVEYQLCEVSNPANCSTGSVKIEIEASKIETPAQTPSFTIGATGGTTPSIVSGNTINGQPVVIGTKPGEVTLTATQVPAGLTLNPDGTVTVPPNTPGGSYTVEYQLCEVSNPANCSTSTVTVAIEASKIESPAQTPSFTIGATGGTTPSIVSGNTINGQPVVIGTKPGEVTLSGIKVPSGFTLNSDGTVTVPPNTPGGSYTVEYQLCEVIIPANCTSCKAKIEIEGSKIEGPAQTPSFTIGATGGTTPSIVSGNTLNGQPVVIGTKPGEVTLTGTKVPAGFTLNPDGTVTVPPNTAGGSYTVEYQMCEVSNPANCSTGSVTIEIKAPANNCEIKVSNAFSPNGDSLNNRFYIQGLECYPDNTVEIYNRWGKLIYKYERYNNEDRVFTGGNGEVAGTYYYVLKYRDSNAQTHEKAGYVFISK